MEEEKRNSWLLLLIKGQFDNKAAQTLGQGPWWLLVVVLLFTVVFAAIPAVNDGFTAARNSAEVARYPGLAEALDQIPAQGWNFTVVHGQLTTAQGVPAQAVLGGWTFVFESPGGNLAEAALAGHKVSYFGASEWLLRDEKGVVLFSGTWDKLSGFQASDLVKNPAAKLLPLLLYASAAGSAVQGMFTSFALMAALVLALTALLGLLGSVRTAGFLSLAPALVTLASIAFLQGVGWMSWFAFPLVFGARMGWFALAFRRAAN